MFIQGRRHLGILRKAKPLPTVPGWSRWQRGRGISCSCLVLAQERGGACAAPRSYLRGPGSGHRNSEHGKRYTRTPRACPLRAGRCRTSVSPILTHSYALWSCWAAAQTPGARTVSPMCIQPRQFPSCTVLGCGARTAAGSRASLPDVNFAPRHPAPLHVCSSFLETLNLLPVQTASARLTEIGSSCSFSPYILRNHATAWLTFHSLF